MKFYKKCGIRIPANWTITYYSNSGSWANSRHKKINIGYEIEDGLVPSTEQLLAHESAHARYAEKGGKIFSAKSETIARLYELHYAVKHKRLNDLKLLVKLISSHSKSEDYGFHAIAAQRIIKGKLFQRACNMLR